VYAGCIAVAAGLAAGCTACAAPHEINVFTDEMEERGEFGLEVHVNYSRGRGTPDYRSEIPPDRALRVMPELVYGLGGRWEVGLHLPMQRDRDGVLHADGLRVRLKHMVPKKEASAFFAGVNVEWGYDRPHLSEDRHNFELRGILGWRTEHWLVAVNPILAWVGQGENRSGRPEFESGLKVARELRPGLAFGVEVYSGFGPLARSVPRHEQDHMIYLAVDYEGKGWGINLGFGTGLTAASDDRVIKAIVGIPLK